MVGLLLPGPGDTGPLLWALVGTGWVRVLGHRALALLTSPMQVEGDEWCRVQA